MPVIPIVSLGVITSMGSFVASKQKRGIFFRHKGHNPQAETRTQDLRNEPDALLTELCKQSVEALKDFFSQGKMGLFSIYFSGKWWGASNINSILNSYNF